MKEDRKEVFEYFIPKEDFPNCGNLNTLFTGNENPEAFLEVAKKIVASATKHKAIITKNKEFNKLTNGGLCFRISRLENDEEYEKRIRRERKKKSRKRKEEKKFLK